MKAEVLRFTEGIDLWLKRADEMLVAEFRDLVWEIFCRILDNTPQWSGKAVANWNLGVGAPDYEFNDRYGSPTIVRQDPRTGNQFTIAPHQAGSSEWIEVAKARNIGKLPRIKRDTRVYFCNNVEGDDDDGLSNTLYLDSLQDESYWMEKLRTVNQPYEIAAESVLFVLADQGRLPGRRFRAGGESMNQANPV